MPNSYFKNFPKIKYLGYNSRNIMASGRLVNKFVNIPYVYYRFDLNNVERPDQVGEAYYGDSYYSWLVFYSNRLIDPYYDWFLTDENFIELLKEKYGSVENSKKQILFFRTNWYNDSREISPDVYESWFGSYKAPYDKYWNPVFDNDSGEIVLYTRKINDTILNTNKLMKIGVSNNTTSANTSKFSNGDLIDIKSGVTQIGTAEVLKSNTSVIYIENVLGTIANTYNIVLDSNSSVQCTIADFSNTYVAGANSWTKTSIAEDEYIYWEPVYAYDYEVELNTLKRTVNLVDKSLAFEIYDTLREELNE